MMLVQGVDTGVTRRHSSVLALLGLSSLAVSLVHPAHSLPPQTKVIFQLLHNTNVPDLGN